VKEKARKRFLPDKQQHAEDNDNNNNNNLVERHKTVNSSST
jgi:hypothetical protein